MADDELIESTLSFQFEARDYEDAAAHPTYYRALGREPRREHPFHVYEDIYRQPELVAAALGAVSGPARRMAESFVGHELQRVLFSGVGASYHLAASAAHALWEISRLPAEYVESSEALLSGAVFDYPGSLVVGLSASGNTIETVQHLQAAREGGAFTVAFTNLDRTRLTETAHDRFVAPGGYGLVWDYTTRLAAILRFAIALGAQIGRSRAELESLNGALEEIPAQMADALTASDDRCRRLGAQIASLRAAVLPASGNLLPNAWEIALRFEEMSHFPARGRPLVDFLHGGVGFLDADILTLLLAPPGPTHSYARRAARVTQIVKTPCIAFLEQGHDSEVGAIVDDVVRIPRTHPALRPLLYVLPGQLLPYYIEITRPGGNPEAQRTDKPRYARAFDAAMPADSH